MQTVKDLLSRRNEFVGGVLEKYPKKGVVTKSTIREISSEGNEVRFIVISVLERIDGVWVPSSEVPDGSIFSFDASLTITEGPRPQFDLRDGSWFIISPAPVSV